MTALESVVRLVYLGAAACFVLGLHEMNSPATARRGNLLSAGGMAAAVLATGVLLAERGLSSTAWLVLAGGALAGWPSRRGLTRIASARYTARVGRDVRERVPA